MSVLTAKEVISNSPAVKELTARPKPVCDILDHTIENYLIALFGEVEYYKIVESVIDYSSSNNWSDSVTYIENDIVIYDGIPYKLIVANNTTNDAPNCSNEWEIAPKFTNECYEKTFVEGKLTKLLSWVVFAEAVPFYPEILSASGFTGTDEQYKEKINFFRSNIYSGIRAMKKQFERWSDKDGCIAIYECIETVDQNKSNRQIAW